MKMSEVIDKVSELYRQECKKLAEMEEERRLVVKELLDAEHTNKRNISAFRYEMLIDHEKALRTESLVQQSFRDGISEVRELLMDLGFDTEVE